MRITYINHSGFLVEMEEMLFLFDYYGEGLEGTGALPGLPKLPEKPLYVFVSHKHHDHFDKRIFGLEQSQPAAGYILSRDARMNEAYMRRSGIPESAFSKISYIGRSVRQQEFPGFSVTTLTSTDEGVAFLVEAEGKRLYHAGDLNWWTWIGETEDEYRDMTGRFQKEIASLSGITIDVAFLPLDPRQEERFYWGFDYFMRHTDTKFAFPMHFWGDSSVIGRLRDMELSGSYRDRIATEEMYRGTVSGLL